MDEIINTLTSNNLYLIIAAIIVLVFAYVIVKKLIKIALFILIILIGYFGYLYYTGKEMPVDANDLKEKISEKISDMKEKAEDKAQELMDEQSEKIKESIDEKLGN